MKTIEWNPMDSPPRLGGEYLVIWNLQDGGEPCTASMDYDAKENKWIDPRNILDGVSLVPQEYLLSLNVKLLFTDCVTHMCAKKHGRFLHNESLTSQSTVFPSTLIFIFIGVLL